MFGMIYRKKILLSFRNPSLMIWTLLFPLGLATLFYLAFGNLDQERQFHVIPVALVSEGEESSLAEFLGELSEGADALLQVTETDREKAESLLEEGGAAACILENQGNPELLVRESGIEQTIVKNILDQYLQQRAAFQKLGGGNTGTAQRAASVLQETEGEEIREVTLTSRKPSEKVTYFYALLAMTCLYGGLQGVVTVCSFQPNITPLGMRRAVSPVRRLKAFLADLLGGYTVQAVSILLVFFYMVLVLKLEVGERLFLAVLNCLAGSLLGVLFGAVIALPARWKEEMKIGIVVSVSMVCCFLAGMMVYGLNYTIKQKLPLLDLFNPASRISDSFYCLYYYEDISVFARNLAIIGAMSAVLLFILVLAGRKKRYESI